jgi:multisubunit Na+/H+ antiporter MnhE subunit
MRRLGTWAAFWVVLFPFWLLYEGEWDAREALGAAAAAAVGAFAATVAVQGTLLGHRFEPRVLRRALRVPWQVVREFAEITVFLVRHPRGPGSFAAYPFSAGRNDPVGRARRAFTALAATYSPNSYVIEIDERENLVLAHSLKPQTREQVTLE